MKYRRILTAVCAYCITTVSVSAQDIHYSQFYMDPLQQNPALAGADHDLEANLNYKNQWSSVAVPYKTIAASYDMRLSKPKTNKKGFWAAGINFYSDNSGDAQLTTTQVNLIAAYHVLTGQYSQLGMGVMGGYAQRSINYSQLQWGNQYDGMEYNAALPTGEPAGANNSVSYIDDAAGLEWTYDNTSGGINVTDNHELKFDVGFSIFHFTQPNYSFYNDGEKLYMRYTFHANALISLGASNLALAPGLLYYKQGTANEEYFGTLVRFMLQQNSKYTGAFQAAALSLGGYYRNQDAFVAAMLLEYANYAMGVSYDFNTSNLTQASKGMGGLELSLRFVMPNPYFQGGSKAGNKSMF
ncbi:MAG TPA: PorP/SprF family type IX secretion system membrane protein [Bacteroidia bacterium]|nr:PorP/SprF family type IX secretion system membrane protein [Bacteroidia bacterium]